MIMVFWDATVYDLADGTVVSEETAVSIFEERESLLYPEDGGSRFLRYPSTTLHAVAPR